MDALRTALKLIKNNFSKLYLGANCRRGRRHRYLPCHARQRAESILQGINDASLQGTQRHG